jgi:hypothetical protein
MSNVPSSPLGKGCASRPTLPKFGARWRWSDIESQRIGCMARELGIVRFAYNVFGSLERYDGVEIYVHKSDLLCEENILESQDYALVVFETSEIPNGKFRARAVRKLTDELEVSQLDADQHYKDEIVRQLVIILEKYPKLQIRINELPEPVLRNQLISKYADPLKLLSFLIMDYSTSPSEDLLEQILFTLEANNQGLPISVRWKSQSSTYLSLEVPLSIVIEKYFNTKRQSDLDIIIRILAHEPDLLSKLPENLILLPSIFALLDGRQKIRMLTKKYRTAPSDELAERIAGLIKENYNFLYSLPADLKSHPSIFPLLSDDEQVEYSWPPTSEKFLSLWDLFSRNAKILAVFRAAKEEFNLFEANSSIQTDDPLVQAALIILWAKYSPERAERAFRRAHQLVEAYVINIAWDSTEPLDFSPFLPRCVPGEVTCCEGRPWFTDEEKENGTLRASRAFCPRLRGPCYISTYPATSSYGASEALNDIPF